VFDFIGVTNPEVIVIGVTNPEVIVAEGVQIGPKQREKALEGALQAATNLHAA
jgi:FMN-dependent NADH-azoreductase